MTGACKHTTPFLSVVKYASHGQCTRTLIASLWYGKLKQFPEKNFCMEDKRQIYFNIRLDVYLKHIHTGMGRGYGSI